MSRGNGWTNAEAEYLQKNPPKNDGDYIKLGLRFGRTTDAVRKKCERLGLPNVRSNVQAKRNGNALSTRIAKAIKNKRASVIELANLFGISPKMVVGAVQELRDEGTIVDVLDDTLQLATTIPPTEKPLVIDFKKHKEVEYPIGFVADNHIGSKYERLDVLEALYDRFAEYGVETVYQGGNMIDGECRFNKYDIYVHGVNDQVKNFVQKFPSRKGIITKFVTGDDHEGWFVQREHINIGQLIEDESKRGGRTDLEFIGHMERDIELVQPNGSAVIRVIHAGGGSTYAISYTSQKYVESLQGGEKPAVVLVGHFHKFDWAYPRNVHVIQGGTTCDQTPFMRKKRIEAHVGGVVLWVRQSETGIFTSVKVEWIPFYDKKFYEYHW